MECILFLFLECLSRTYEELKLWARKKEKIFFKSLSRTYEELKRFMFDKNYRDLYGFIAYLWGIETWCLMVPNGAVYRVPMRNWNILPFITYFETYFAFIAYLWGIETCWTTCDIRSISDVYRVPMRNWN